MAKLELMATGAIVGFLIDVVLAAATLSYGPPASPFAAFMGWSSINMTYYGLFLWLGIAGYIIGSAIEPARPARRKRKVTV